MSDLQQAAQAILDHCHPGTPRHDIAWAAGVTLCDHAFYFATLPILQGHRPGWGYCAAYHRAFNCDRKGMHLFADGWLGALAVPVIRWSEISAVVTLDRIGSDLHRQICELVDRQRNPQLPVRLAWDDLLAESHRLAEQAWVRCRPGAQRQMDLFDALVGAP